MIRIGVRAPSGLKFFRDQQYNPNTGMEYELWGGTSGDLINASHEDVGLITWFYAEQGDWEAIINGQEV